MKVKDRHRPGDNRDILCRLREALTGDADRIIAERHGIELEFPVASVVTLFAHSDDFAWSITMAF